MESSTNDALSSKDASPTRLLHNTESSSSNAKKSGPSALNTAASSSLHTLTMDIREEEDNHHLTWRPQGSKGLSPASSSATTTKTPSSNQKRLLQNSHTTSPTVNPAIATQAQNIKKSSSSWRRLWGGKLWRTSISSSNENGGEEDATSAMATAAESTLSEDDFAAVYTSLEDEPSFRQATANPHTTTIATTTTTTSTRPRSALRRPRSLWQSTEGRHGTNGSSRTVDVLLRQGRDTTTHLASTEDSLQQDCHFFFRSQDDNEAVLMRADGSPGKGRRTRRGFRVLRQEEHQHSFSYRDAVDVLAPTFLKHYLTRYHQLNQDYSELTAKAADPTGHSLSLHEGNEGGHDPHGSSASSVINASNASIVQTDTAIHSSLFYQHHGRLLMRLPMDQVRLFMDPDMEAGILSVEQWRGEEEGPNSNSGPLKKDQARTRDETGNVLDQDSDGHERPPLRYVMTVHSDLYRRIVSEMSDGLTKPYCGMSRCCHDNEKADIRIALAILVVVLLVILINVFVWGPVS